MDATKVLVASPKAVSVADGARYSGFSESYIRLLIERRKLPAIRVGRAVRLLVSDLDSFLAAHRVEAR